MTRCSAPANGQGWSAQHRSGSGVASIRPGAWVKEQKVEVADGKVVAYQVILQVTFVLDD